LIILIMFGEEYKYKIFSSLFLYLEYDRANSKNNVKKHR
jgi:hypothetical protein